MKRKEMLYTVQKLLEDVGMDTACQNERSALTLLALAHLDPSKEWEDATGKMYKIHQLIGWIRDNPEQDYAESILAFEDSLSKLPLDPYH